MIKILKLIFNKHKNSAKARNEYHQNGEQQNYNEQLYQFVAKIKRTD